MTDDHPTANSPQAGDDGPSVRRRWNCPSEEMLASYLDGAMGSGGRSRIEPHLADCEYCRSLVADAVRLQRFDAAAVPFDLKQKAIALAAPKSRRSRWILLPAAAIAGTALVVIATFMLRSPQQLLVPSPSIPSPPVIAKSEPAPTLNGADHDVVRKIAPTDLLPTIIFPKQDNAVTREQLEFKWMPVPRSRYYEVHVVTSEGDLVWEGQSDRAVLKFPGDRIPKDGPYFVWISAYLDDGRVQKSAPVRFLVTASR
jgi:Putative zinc-finger